MATVRYRVLRAPACIALLALAACARQGEGEMSWARSALERNAAFEVVAADEQSRTFTVRMKDTGELRVVRADQLIAGVAAPATGSASAQAALCRDAGTVTSLEIERNHGTRIPQMQNAMPDQVTISNPASARDGLRVREGGPPGGARRPGGPGGLRRAARRRRRRGPRRRGRGPRAIQHRARAARGERAGQGEGGGARWRKGLEVRTGLQHQGVRSPGARRRRAAARYRRHERRHRASA